jgi:hypothetical protein
MERSDFPEVGTRLTYGDRLPVRQLYLNGRPYGLYP